MWRQQLRTEAQDTVLASAVAEWFQNDGNSSTDIIGDGSIVMPASVPVVLIQTMCENVTPVVMRERSRSMHAALTRVLCIQGIPT
eukprot:3106724-Rhodomonas_salina.3